MELPPGAPQPMPYYSGYQPGPARPKSISVIAIFAIVLSTLGCLCGGIGLIFSAVALSSTSNVFARTMQNQSDFQKAWDIIQPFASLALSVVLLVGGIGAVQVREWARTLLVRWSPIQIGFQLINGAIHLYFVSERMPMLRQTRLRNATPAFAGGYAVGQVIGVLAMVVLLCILPICILNYWRRPEVVEAFNAPQFPN